MIYDLVDKHIADFEESLNKVVKAMISEIQSLLAGLKTQSGNLLFEDGNLQLSIEMFNDLVTALNTAGYEKAYTELLMADPELITELKKYTSSLPGAVPLTFAQSSLTALSTLQNMELTRFGKIGSEVMTVLQDQLTTAVLTGQSLRQATKDITGLLEKDLVKYAKTYANTSRQQFIQAVHNEAAKNTDGAVYWEYIGVLDNVTRDECRAALAQRLFTDDEKNAYENETEPRYNCRHNFIQVTEDYYKDGINTDSAEQ